MTGELATDILTSTTFELPGYTVDQTLGMSWGLIVRSVGLTKGLTGTGYDLPEVGPIFEEYVKENGLSSRVKFVPGSFFTDAIPTADVITMGHILHDWDLEEKKALIAKAYNALPSGGALIVYEALIDDDRSKNAFGLMMSLNMLIETPGGFDYTGADCQGWMKDAGFRETRVEHLAGPESMVVGIK